MERPQWDANYRLPWPLRNTGRLRPEMGASAGGAEKTLLALNRGWFKAQKVPLGAGLGGAGVRVRRFDGQRGFNSTTPSRNSQQGCCGWAGS